jgi:hypothetical protein
MFKNSCTGLFFINTNSLSFVGMGSVVGFFVNIIILKLDVISASYIMLAVISGVFCLILSTTFVFDLFYNKFKKEK